VDSFADFRGIDNIWKASDPRSESAAFLFRSGPPLPPSWPLSELIWAELKDAGPVVRKGEFPVILVCNAEPVIRLDPDVDPDAGG